MVSSNGLRAIRKKEIEMKYFLFFVTSVFSLSSFSSEISSEVFTAKAITSSDFILQSGCGQAKKDAREAAMEQCFQKGYTVCKLQESKKLESSKAGIYLVTEESEGILSSRFAYKAGRCVYEATVLGFN